MNSLPTGTVTFLFTDIEGSTKLAQQYPDEMPVLLRGHHEILREAIQAQNGYIFQNEGDSLAVAFHSAIDALNTAIHAQKLHQSEAWTPAAIRVRMGIHTGAAQLNEPSAPTVYTGYTTLATAARIMSTGHGGQILLSSATRELVHNSLPKDSELMDLGEKRLKDLLRPEHIFQLNITGLRTSFPPLKTLDISLTNLPTQLSTFIGREKEIEQVKQRLEKNRLVTLTRSGGVGKTRLSIQVASELLNEYPNGAWLVELAPITDPEFVARGICAVLDITLSGNTSPLTVLTEYLHAKKLLLVMDNCERLIETCAQICDSLLHACPDLSILASSREALGIDGENSYHVPSLSSPDPKSGLVAIEGTESVKLFMDRATALHPEFGLTAANASSVAQICKRLDGIPLAIELAASRVKLLNVEQIASRLDDAFRLLTGGSRTALPRQQTLRALIDWSYNLLSEQEKILFRRLAVFAGGWTLEAAESVCSGEEIEAEDVIDLMANLVDKSLIVVTREGTESRYRRLETIRQYAREKLAESGESETLRNRHMEYFCQLVERVEPGLRGPDQVVLLDDLEAELDNLRATLEWTLDHNVSAGLQLTSRLKWFWHLRGLLSEGAGWLDRLLSMEVVPHSDSESDAVCRAKALLVFAFLTVVLGDRPKSTASVLQSMALGEKMDDAIRAPLLADSYHLLGAEAITRNDINQARVQAEKSLELFQRTGNKFGIAEVQSTLLMVIAIRSGDLDAARRLSESALAIRKELGDKDGVAFGLNNSGLVALGLGDYDRATASFKAAVEASRENRDDYNLGPALGNLAVTYLFKGEMDLAREYILQGAKLAQEKWNPMHKANSIYWLAMYSFEQKRFRKFIQLNSYLESEKSHLSYLYFLPQTIQATFQRNITAAQAQLDEEDLQTAEAEGKAIMLDQAFDYALEGFDE